MAIYRILLRRGTAAEWASINPTLANGELGLEQDTQKLKAGNGTAVWNALPYLPPSAHQSTHALGGTDPLTPSDIGTLSAAQIESMLDAPGSRLIHVDCNRTDSYPEDGTLHRPYKTIQAAHDYAALNMPATSTDWRTLQVSIRINAGNYLENLIITRPNIHFVGSGGAKTRDVVISGTVRVNLNTNPAGTRDNNLVSFSNLIVYGSSTNTLFVAAGTASYQLFLAHVHLSANSTTTGKAFEVTNTSTEGIKVEIREVLVGNPYSASVAMDFNNTSWADIDQLSVESLNTAVDFKTTYAVIANSRFQSTDTTNAIAVIKATSPFTAGQPTLILGNCTISNLNTNGDGLFIAFGAIASVGQVVFSVGTAAGTGCAVNGVAGAMLASAANLVAFGTNSKVATGITNTSIGTSLTRSGVNLDARTPSSHTHDDRYYTESEVNSLLSGKQATGNYATIVSAPASATATGTAGRIAYDANFVYVCTAPNTWVRAALAAW